MTTRSAPLRLHAWTGAESRATGTWRVFDRAHRLRRAGSALGLGAGIALLMLPIPIVHFAGVPGGLLFGLVAAADQFATPEILREADGACPHCDTAQRFLVGTGLRKVGLPTQVFCKQCGKPSTLEAPAA